MSAAFERPRRPNILEKLQKAEQSRYVSSTAFPVPNIVRSLTAGSRQLHQLIEATPAIPQEFKAFREGSPTNLATAASAFDSRGKLLLDVSLPIMKRRYAIGRHIATGSFSTVCSAQDQFCMNSSTVRQNSSSPSTVPCEVAVKFMDLGYNDVGQRELTFLRHLSAIVRRGPNPCKYGLFPYD